MATYRRAHIPGGTYFFTVVTHGRQPLLSDRLNIDALGRAFRRVRDEQPFTMDAFVLLPDHLHCLWTLPEGDTDYSSRWRDIKKYASKEFLFPPGSQQAWQRGFWEHVIRDEHDWQRHMDYIHYNPVKHGWARSPQEWQWSSFHQCVKKGWYEPDWGTQPPPRCGGDELGVTPQTLHRSASIAYHALRNPTLSIAPSAAANSRLDKTIATHHTSTPLSAPLAPLRGASRVRYRLRRATGAQIQQGGKP